MLSADTRAVLPLIMLSFLPLSAALLTKEANSPRPSLFLTAPDPPLASSLHITQERQILCKYPERPGTEQGLLSKLCSSVQATRGPVQA